MANKKNSLDDLDFDNLDFDKLDFGDGPDIKDDRKASQKATSAFAKGVRDSFVKPANIRNLAANALPRGYGSAINTAVDMQRSLAGLYDTAAKELKPALPAMRRMVGRATPHLEKALPNSVNQKLKDFSSQKDSAGYSQMDGDSATIAQSMGDIFKVQMQSDAHARAEDKAEQRIQNQVVDIRMRSQISQLQGIRDNTSRLVAYQDQVTHKFQQKSLELQYRSYFVQRDTLKLLMGNSDRDKLLLEAIVKNTALPDIVKIKNSERAGGMLRDKLLGSIGNAANEYSRTFMRKLMANATMNIRGAMSSGADAVMSIDDMQQMMEGMDGAGSMSEMLMGTFGEMAGGFLMDNAGRYLQPHLRKRKGLARKGNQLQYGLNNLPGMVNAWARGDKGESGMFGWLVRLLKAQVPTFAFDNTLKGSPMLSMDKPAIFDRQVHTSIVQVIPGLLSRIHQELVITRTGNPNAELVSFNMDRGIFTKASQVTADVKARMVNTFETDGVNRGLNTVLQKSGLEGKLSKELERKVKMQLIEDGLSGRTEGLTKERYGGGKENLTHLTVEDQLILAKVIGNFYDDEDQANLVNSQQAMKDLVARLPAWRERAIGYQRTGNLEDLRKLGYVDGDGFNNKLNLGKLSADVIDSGMMTYEERQEYLRNNNLQQGASRETLKALAKGNRMFKKLLKRGKNAVKGGAQAIWDASPEEVRKYGIKSADQLQTLLDTYGDELSELKNKVSDTTADDVMAWGRDKFETAKTHYRDLKQKAFDLYDNRGNLLIQAKKLQDGEYRDQLTNRVITEIKDITGPVVDRYDRVVLSTQDAIDGLKDVHGEEISEVSEKIKKTTQKMVDSARPLQTFLQGKARKLGEAGTVATAQSDNGEIVQLNAQQVSLLQAIHETLMAGLTIQAGGDLGGSNKRAFFGRLDRGLFKGALAVPGMALKGLKNYFKASYGLLWKGVRGTFNAATGIVGSVRDVLTDVRVAGSTQIVLYADKIRKGEYVDVRTKKVIKRLKDITGEVINSAGEVVLSQEDYEKGIFDTYGRRIVGAAGWGIGKVFKTVGAGFKLYFNAVNLAYRAAKWGMDTLADGFKSAFSGARDVYVKGERDPRLKAVLMKSPEPYYFNRETGKPVRNVRDALKGEVVDRRGQILISNDDIQKGLVDSHGKPFKSLGTKLMGAARWATDWAIRGAKGWADLAWGAVGAAKNVALGVLGIPGRLRGGMDPKYWMGHSEKILSVLTQMRDILDQRLAPTGPVQGSWQQRQADAKEKAKAKAEEIKETVKQSKGPLAGLVSMFSKVKGFFNPEDEEDEEEDGEGDGGDTTIIAGGDGKRERRDGVHERAKRMKASRRRRGKLGWLYRGKDKLGGLMKRAPGGRLLGKGRRLLGGPGKILSGLALALGGDYLLDKTLGKSGAAREGADKAINVAGDVSTAAAVAGMLGGGSAATAGGVAGGAAAGAAGATAAGVSAGGLAAGAGSIAAGIIGSPVLLPAAIIAGVAAGGYLAYRHLRYKSKQLIRRFRFAQYGVDDQEDTGHTAAIVKLEAMLQSAVKVGPNGQPDMVQDVDFTKIMGLFDQGEYLIFGDASGESRHHFVTWFSNRFKPVYFAYRAALQGLDPKMELADIDDELPGDKQIKLLTLVQQASAGVMGVMSPPWPEYKMQDTSGLAARAFDEAMAEAKKKAKGGGSLSRAGRMWAGTVKFLTAVPRGFAEVTGINKKLRSNEKLQSWLKKQGGFIRGLAQGLGIEAGDKENTDRKVVAERLAKLKGLPSRLMPLQAIRFKTYGLVKLDEDRVDALYLLENHVLEDVTYSGDNVASFDKSAKDYWSKFATKFGLVVEDSAARTRWTEWFDKRFLPTVLAFATAVKFESPSMDPVKADDMLKPKQRFAVATAVLNATYSYMVVTKRAVWKYTESPWDKHPLNDDPATCADNYLALKNSAKAAQGQYGETTATSEAARAKQSTMYRGGQAAAAVGSGKNYGAATTAPGAYNGNGGTDEYRVKTSEEMGWGTPPPMGRTADLLQGTGGKIDQIPNISGYTREGLTQAIAAAAKMVGVDPNLLMQMAKVESTYGKNRVAKGSSARGIFQFTSDTWNDTITKYGRRFGIPIHTDPMDDRANILLGALFTRDNLAFMKQKLKRTPTFGDAYAAHFLGKGGAGKLMSLPGDSVAAASMRDAAEANRNIFYHKNGQPRTVNEVIGVLNGKMESSGGSSIAFTATPDRSGSGGKADFSGVQAVTTSSNDKADFSDVRGSSSYRAAPSSFRPVGNADFTGVKGGSSAIVADEGSGGGVSGDYASESEAGSFISVVKGINLQNLHPTFRRYLFGMIAEYGKKSGKTVTIKSGWRSMAQQAALFRQYGPGRAARPGRSLHEFGMAVDIDPADANAMEKLGLMKKYGMTRPIGGEPWHVEPVGIQNNIAEAKANRDAAHRMIIAGLGKGGAGFGAQPGAKKWSRGGTSMSGSDNSNVASAATAADTTPPPSMSPSASAAASMGMGRATPSDMNTAAAGSTQMRSDYEASNVNAESKTMSNILQKQLEVQVQQLVVQKEMRDHLKTLTSGGIGKIPSETEKDPKKDALPTSGSALKRLLDNPVATEMASAAVSMLRKQL